MKKKTTLDAINDLDRAVEELGNNIKGTWLAKKLIDIANKAMSNFNKEFK